MTGQKTPWDNGGRKSSGVSRMKQVSFSDYEYGKRKKTTKRDEFLAIMDSIIPWEEWAAFVEPYYPKGERGRTPRGIVTMLRMYLLQCWFNLSDEGVEDAIYDSYAMRKFMGINFTEEQAPDATTLCKFRQLLEKHGIGAQMFAAIRKALEEHGHRCAEEASWTRASLKRRARQRTRRESETRRCTRRRRGMRGTLG